MTGWVPRLLTCVLSLGLIASAGQAPGQTLDDQLCYKTKRSRGTAKFSKRAGLSLSDPLGSRAIDAKKPKYLCAPAAAAGTPSDPDTHLTAYRAKAARGSAKAPRLKDFRVATELGVLFLDTTRGNLLMLGSSVDRDVTLDAPEPAAPGTGAFRCYKTRKPRGFKKMRGIGRSDWMSGERDYDLAKPSHYCPPATIDGEEPGDSAPHLVCYKAKASRAGPRHDPLSGLKANDMFGPLSFDTKKEALLCTPATAVQGCGDGVLQDGEQCDDGGRVPGDGCSEDCQSELPFTVGLVNMNILHNITQGNVGFTQLDDRLTLLADRIAESDPDIVTLQEVVLGGNDASVRLVDDLGARHGLVYQRISYGSTVGNAVLSRWPLTLEETTRLPTEETVASHPDRRFAARAVVSSPIGPLDVYSMHMCAGSIGCTQADRVVQTSEFIDFVDSTHSGRHPAIVAGDFNSHLGSAPDQDPASGPAMQAMLDQGWQVTFDGFDAPCNPPADRSGCTDNIDDLTVADDTSSRRIDNILLVAGSADSPRGPATVASEVGPTSRFGDSAAADPNPRCVFTPRDYCSDNFDCGLLEPQVYCGRIGFCQTIIPCTIDSDCPSETYGEMVCGTTLWISDHVGVETSIVIKDAE